jgi:hypothetical protein
VALRALDDLKTGGLEDSCVSIAGMKRNEITLKHSAVVDPPFTMMEAPGATSMPRTAGERHSKTGYFATGRTHFGTL